MADEPEEIGIDPSPPPPEPPKQRRWGRRIFHAFLVVWAAVAAWNLFKPLPDGMRVRGEIVDTPLGDIRFLADVTTADAFGARVVRQQIFDAMFALIGQAREYVVLDFFLFNSQRGAMLDTKPARALSAELRDALLARKRAVPGLRVLLIADPVNDVYGGLPSRDLKALTDAGIDVVRVDLDRLRDSNPVYSAFWRLTMKWWSGDGSGDAFLPNPLDAGPERVSFGTPIDENDPSDAMSFVSYLKREQYGSRPLLYGEYFTAQPINIKQGAPIYKKGKDKYEVQGRKSSYEYSPNDMTILPRIYSRDPNQQDRYREILGLKEGQKPTFSDNMKFMFKHQIGTMYGRYFLWNFAGRKGDEIGSDWVGPNDWFEKLPDHLASNKAYNNFFMIPFILGLIGMYFQMVYDQKNMGVVGLLFILTGVALVVYLNGPASEPRERDYIYAASYYAYCFWIGFAVIAFATWINKLTKNLKIATIAAIAICASAPAIMAAEGWDDHDRSDRYFSVGSAVNYLESCAPNAILFTGGDNDTFPLWYAQEVEGVRTDMRVLVLSYYNTDWYIKQSMTKHYESEPLPYTLSLYQYRQDGPNDYLPYEDLKIKAMDLEQYIGLLSKDYQGLRLYPSANVVPTKDIVLNVDVDKVKSMGIIPEGMDSLLVPQMLLRVKGGALEKKDLALLDVLLTNKWERPIYVNNTSLSQFNIDLTPYLVAEGNTYRILPILNRNPRTRLVNTEVAYTNMMKKFQFKGLDNPNAYFTQDYRNFVLNHRGSFNELAQALLDKGDKEKAREVILYSLEKMPNKSIPYDVSNARNIEMLFEVGEKEKAIEVANDLGKQMDEMSAYYMANTMYDSDFYNCVLVLGEIQRVLYKYGEADLAKNYEDKYRKYAGVWQMER